MGILDNIYFIDFDDKRLAAIESLAEAYDWGNNYFKLEIGAENEENTFNSDDIPF